MFRLLHRLLCHLPVLIPALRLPPTAGNPPGLDLPPLLQLLANGRRSLLGFLPIARDPIIDRPSGPPCPLVEVVTDRGGLQLQRGSMRSRKEEVLESR